MRDVRNRKTFKLESSDIEYICLDLSGGLVVAVSTRILAVSDIFWRRRPTLDALIKLVEQHQPALVLVAGDLVNDGPGPNLKNWERIRLAFWEEAGKFLDYLEAQSIQAYLIRGNWDEVAEYNALMARPYKHIQEISEKQVEFNNIKILGIPHSVTNRLSTMKTIQSYCPTPVDIILTHAVGTRRVRFFELPTQMVITGHFDERLTVIRNKVMISFSSFPEHYAVIDYEPQNIGVTYFYKTPHEEIQHKVQVRSGVPAWQSEEAKNWSAKYGGQMEALLRVKDQAERLDFKAKREAIEELLDLRVPKAQILEFVPDAPTVFKTFSPPPTR